MSILSNGVGKHGRAKVRGMMGRCTIGAKQFASLSRKYTCSRLIFGYIFEFLLLGTHPFSRVSVRECFLNDRGIPSTGGFPATKSQVGMEDQKAIKAAPEKGSSILIYPRILPETLESYPTPSGGNGFLRGSRPSATKTKHT